MFDFVNGLKLKETNGKINQVQRNELRANALNELLENLKSLGVECGRIKEGIAIEIPNEELGCVSAIIDLKIKDTNYYMQDEIDNYNFELREKQKALEEKAKAKAQKIKADTERREKLRLEKELAEKEQAQ